MCGIILRKHKQAFFRKCVSQIISSFDNAEIWLQAWNDFN